MKKMLAPKTVKRLRPLLTVAALFALNTVSAFAQSTTFNSTDLRTGISNSLAVIMMFGFVLGIMVFFVLLVVMDSSLTTSFLVALVPVSVCLAYIFALRQGKPPGYDRDCFEYLFTGRGFSPQSGRNCTHPLL